VVDPVMLKINTVCTRLAKVVGATTLGN